jgi:hypothetical protein
VSHEELRAKHKAGVLTPCEREELQDLLDRDAAGRAAQPAVAIAKAPQHVDPVGDINTDNLTPSDRQKIQEMVDRYIRLPMNKAEKVEQAQKMLAYLKSQLPADKADQAFRVLAEKGIFHQLLYAGPPIAACGVIALEVVSGIAIAPEVLLGALIVGGVYVTYEVGSYLIDKVRSTFGDTAAREAEDTLYRKGNVGDRSRSIGIPRSGTQSSAAGGNPDPDDKCQKKVPKSGSGKELAKDVPSRFRGERPYIWESGRDFAKRLLDAEYGEGNYDPRTNADFSKLKKWGERGFELPKCSKKSKK